MQKYKIPVSYEMYGYVEIEAENINEAIDKAYSEHTPLPDNAEYVSGSFNVDNEVVEECNNLSPEDKKMFNESYM